MKLEDLTQEQLYNLLHSVERKVEKVLAIVSDDERVTLWEHFLYDEETIRAVANREGGKIYDLHLSYLLMPVKEVEAEEKKIRDAYKARVAAYKAKKLLKGK